MSKKEEAIQAPPPAFLKSVIEQNRKDVVVEPGEHRDKIMAEFSSSDAWKLIKKFITAKQMEIAKGVREASDGSASLEEIGFRFLAADQTNTFISQLITFVESTAKIMELKNEQELRSRGDSSRG